MNGFTRLMWAACLSVASATSPCLAQPRPTELEGKGQVEAAIPGGVRAVINGNVFLIGLSPQTKVSVRGTASKDLLIVGTPVAFTADLDDKGKPTAAVEKISVFVGEEPGIHSEAAFGDQIAAKPTRRRGPGTYRVVGTIRGMSPDGEFFVAAGSERVTFAVAENVAVEVDSPNIGLVSPGDAVDVKGKYLAPDIQPGQPVPPMVAQAEELTITLSKPLEPKSKKRPQPPRPPKKQPAEAGTP